MIIARISMRKENTMHGSCSEPSHVQMNQRAQVQMLVAVSTWNHLARVYVAYRPALIAWKKWPYEKRACYIFRTLLRFNNYLYGSQIGPYEETCTLQKYRQ